MHLNNIPNIAIVTVSPFPIGIATSNRTISLCKGFLRNNYSPIVICIKPTEKPDRVFNYSPKGIYQDISYIYPGGTTIRSKSFVLRRFHDSLGFVKSIILILQLKRTNKLK